MMRAGSREVDIVDQSHKQRYLAYNRNPKPIEKFDLFPYMAMSRSVIRDHSSFVNNLSGKHFNPSLGKSRNSSVE